MISPLLRALIVIVLCISSLLLFIYLRSVHASKVKRASAMLILLSIYFPFTDLSFTPFDIRITPFDFTLWSFLLVNLDFIKEFKNYKLLNLILIMMVFTSLLSEFPMDSLFAIPKNFRVFVLFVVAMVYFKNQSLHGQLRSIIKIIKWPAICAIIFGLIQIFIDSSFSLFYSQWNKEARISSCFMDPQIAACCISILAVFYLNLFLCFQKFEYLTFFLLLTFVGLLTGSKVFLIGMVCAILLSLLNNKNRRNVLLFTILSVFLFVLTFNGFKDTLIFQRLIDFESSYEGRQELYWLGAIDIFTNNWFSGIGVGVFQQYIEKYNYPMTHYINNEMVYAFQPESGYLLWLDEYGIFSILYILAIIFLMKQKNAYFEYRLVLLPFLIAFVSLYNLTSGQVVYLVALFSSAILGSRRIISR